VAAEMVDEKKHSAESEEAEEEEFLKYGAVDEFYNLDKEIGKWVVSGMSFVVYGVRQRQQTKKLRLKQDIIWRL